MQDSSSGKEPNLSNKIIVRLTIPHQDDMLAKVIEKITDLNGHVGAIDIVRSSREGSVRDFSITADSNERINTIIDTLKRLPEATFNHFSDRTFLTHLGGKIEVKNKMPIRTRDDLSMAYTPGVARICMAIHENPADAYHLTIKRNTVAIVSDGTAVLGLGDIGPEAAMPVMEGKAMLFKEYANVDAWPICLDTKDTEEIIQIVKAIAPGFGGVNLEDISAPRCFEIERRLKEEMNIPVFHDDQHGTAVVSTAAVINALKIVNKKPEELKVVVMGVGAAGTACTKMLMQLGVRNIIGCDRKGAVHMGRSDLNTAKQWYAENTNPNQEQGKLSDVIAGADLFLGVSAPNMLTVDDLKKMNKDPIIFAMANPIPEIMPEEALPYVAVMATGRSDYPNQINNVLCFPGLFRGALDCLASEINEEMKMAAAQAIAGCIEESHLYSDYIIPSVFDSNVASSVAKAVVQAAISSGVAKRINA